MNIYSIRPRRVIFALSITVLMVWLLFASACARAEESPQLPPITPLVLPATWTPTATATPVPTYTPVVAGLPTYILPPAVVDQQVSSYMTYHPGLSSLYVAGVAVNRGTVEAGEVRVAVSLLDAKGNVLAAGSLNETHFWYVPPGGKFPFLVPIPTALKEWQEIKIQFETVDPNFIVAEQPRQPSR